MKTIDLYLNVLVAFIGPAHQVSLYFYRISLAQQQGGGG